MCVALLSKHFQFAQVSSNFLFLLLGSIQFLFPGCCYIQILPPQVSAGLVVPSATQLAARVCPVTAHIWAENILQPDSGFLQSQEPLPFPSLTHTPVVFVFQRLKKPEKQMNCFSFHLAIHFMITRTLVPAQWSHIPHPPSGSSTMQ